MKFRIAAGLATIVVAVGLVGAGVASAAPRTIEYFTISASSFDGPQTVVATGPIAATGTDVELKSHVDEFTFPDGTITVRHKRVTATQKMDKRTCTFHSVETGTYTISKGTGAYRHISGSGKYKATFSGTGCSQTEPPASVSIVIQLHGPLSLPA